MTSFAVTWDYRCPFARNAHEHVLAGLEAGADWDVPFVPFSLGQVHVDEGELADLGATRTTTAACSRCRSAPSCATRSPDAFLAVHGALFALRHDQGRDLRDEAVLREVLDRPRRRRRRGLRRDRVGRRARHGAHASTSEVAKSHDVWGVPTFIVGDRAVFVRFMDRPEGDGELGRRTIERVVDLLDGFPELNEFKHTSLSR